MLKLDKLKEAFEKVTNDMRISKGDGMQLAKKIEQFMNAKCKEYKQKYKMNVGVYFTPQA